MPIMNTEKVANKSENGVTIKTARTSTPTTTTTTTTTSTTTTTTTTTPTTTMATTTTTKYIRPSTQSYIDTNSSKNKLIAKDKVMIDIAGDDHDEQPDDSANNFSTNNFFDVPQFPQASLVEKQEDVSEENRQEFVDEANVPKCPSRFTRGLEWPPTRLNQVPATHINLEV